MSTLEKVKIGEEVTAKRIAKESTVRRRLLDMGITPGVTIKVTGKAPMGDPIEILVRGYKLTLRKNEASAIFVE
ncbi:FeoA family protein [Clostridium chauvoei]|uniref:Ferrous iron transport protein A n=2 Tax=Clostridium chauvoei TaxID=46867 RepID=A0ABD4RIJ7_9CLOT|nr:FeoA family protein [Clostridium chauvoei]ATD54823.1 ferrous iron transport protein A [Clostridium chauvoei]ATD57497.1 ferrous iron transport protein A [Clostridium chauvoei]MBX7281174.1 ferrous iron transport protein A [Clostridium chauvoei]MBX7283650.1 ferrous iron transport protein A [Clostridium chauvoei]MBX7286258.1 ferrous iron transport protein A [Clostridium chauvoei]